jgi:hypothetical protein
MPPLRKSKIDTKPSETRSAIKKSDSDNHGIPAALQSLQQPRAPDRHFHSVDRAGSTSKSVIKHPRPFGKAKKEVQRTYTRELKLQVLSFWLHHQISTGPTTFRNPSTREVAACYLLPRTTILAWRKPEVMDAIINSRRRSRRVVNTRTCQWPEMEERLYEAYRIRREERKTVRRGWL